MYYSEMEAIKKPGEARREEFLDLAEELFGDLGYQNTSIELINSGLGVSKGAFYHHFKSKSALLDASLARILQRIEVEVTRLLKMEMTATEKLRNFVLSINNVKSEKKSALIHVGKPLLEDANAELLVRQKRLWRKKLVPVLTKIMLQGELEDDFRLHDAQLTASVVYGILESLDEALMHPLIGKSKDREKERELLSISDAYSLAIERVLGASEKTLNLINSETIKAWVALNSNQHSETKSGEKTW